MFRFPETDVGLLVLRIAYVTPCDRKQPFSSATTVKITAQSPLRFLVGGQMCAVRKEGVADDKKPGCMR